MNSLARPLFAEFLGTLILVMLAGMALASIFSTVGDMTINLIVGLSYAGSAILVYYAFSHYSSGHFNPAISLGVATAGGMTWSHMGMYWLMQFLGAIAGGALVVYFYGINFGDGVTNAVFIKDGRHFKVMLVEAFLSFILVSAFLFSQEHHHNLTGLITGTVILTTVLAGYSLSGAYINPAYSFGTMIYNKQISEYWMYLVGPLLGSIVAAIIFRFFRNKFWNQEDSKACTKTLFESEEVVTITSTPMRTPMRNNIHYSPVKIPDENTYNSIINNNNLSNPIVS